MLEIHSQRPLTCLPTDNLYLLENWLPTDTEWTASTPDLQVIGEIPKDLNGVYLRNGHNQVHAPIGKYHPFDGDGMVHGKRIADGKAISRWARMPAGRRSRRCTLVPQDDASQSSITQLRGSPPGCGRSQRGAQFVSLDGLGDFGWAEDPPVFNVRVLDFLSRRFSCS